ncbi:MAG: DUF2834 domain-containing protein [Myxococcales bacterium]|nr:DUF2834 domain-containing protein [Myxococcales bacterium]
MKTLSRMYLVFAALGLATALYYAGPYWLSPGASLANFRALAYANAPAATLSVDVTVLYFLANVFILYEGRQRGMRHLWVYVLCNTFVAVAFGLSLFLWRREHARDGASAR